MVQTHEELESLLNRLERSHQRLEDGTVLVGVGSGQPPVALRLSSPVLVVQVAIGEAPIDNPRQEAELFRQLLKLNVEGLVHAAYGLEGSTIVLSSALELENLDQNELEAVLYDIDVALAEHVPNLRKLVR